MHLKIKKLCSKKDIDNFIPHAKKFNIINSGLYLINPCTLKNNYQNKFILGLLKSEFSCFVNVAN